jgi:2-oxo-3-hexenedioate decarboxylase
VRDTGLPVGNWRELCFNWLEWQGYIDGPGVRSFAKNFVHDLQAGSPKLPRFSAIYPAADLDSAFASQRRIARQIVSNGGEVAGYKGGYTSAAAQASMGIDGPLHGVLFRSGRLEAATKPKIKVSPNRALMVELEIGYVMATDVGTKLRVPRQAMTTVEALVPVIELPVNLGPLTEGDDTAVDAVAANIGSAQFIVGDATTPTDIQNLDTLAVSLQLDGATTHSAKGGDVKGGQAETLMQLINQIIEQGHVIHRGDIIICGALGGAKPGQKGNYRADFGKLGIIEFSLD